MEYKLSAENISAIEQTLSSGKDVEVRLDKNREIAVYEVEKTVIAREEN